MIRPVPRARSCLTGFAGAAGRYWLSVFPSVSREVSGWERRAREIPDPALRALALTALRAERGNLEGAAAFAAFLEPARRASVVRALVAFQAAYDYADALSEQPSARPVANARRLHGALPAALGLGGPARDFYRHNQRSQDAGYLQALVDACWTAVRALPSYAAVAAMAQSAARRIEIYQSLNLSESHGGRRALARWAKANTPAGAGLHWWETAAAAGSSLLVFALIAAAARPRLDAAQGRALTRAYFPWIGALHTLLDSLIDEAEDVRTGHRSLIDYYGSPEEAARRLQAIAAQAARHARALPCDACHSLILAAMASFYLSAAPPSSPCARLARPLVLAAMGELAAPSMLVMGARRHAARRRPDVRGRFSKTFSGLAPGEHP